jgi:O-antigen/teichoic acid export membrane protein
MTTIGSPVADLQNENVPSLRRNFRWFLAGNLFYAASQWGMLSVLAKAGSPVVVGEFSLGLALSAPIFMFASLNLRAAQATDAVSRFEFADYFTLRLFTAFLAVLVVLVLLWMLPKEALIGTVAVLLGVAKAIESLGDVVVGLLIKVERIHQAAISLMIRGALTFGSFSLLFLYSRSLKIAVVALVLSWGAVFLMYDIWRARAVVGRSPWLHWRPHRIRALVAVSLPLGTVLTMISLNANIPRYLLAHYRNNAEVGIFSSFAYVLVGMLLVTNALGESATARMSRMFAAGDKGGFSHVMRMLLFAGCAMFFGGTLLAAVFGRPALSLIYRPEYADHVAVFVVMMASGGLTTIAYFLGYGINAARHFRLQVPVIMFSVVVTSVMTTILAPRIGMMGAALALVASSITQLLGNAIALRYAVRHVVQSQLMRSSISESYSASA